jgi:hypothetical protein
MVVTELASLPFQCFGNNLRTPCAPLFEIGCHIDTHGTVSQTRQPSQYVPHSQTDHMTDKGHALEPDAMGYKLALRIPEIAAVSFPAFHEFLRLFP